MTNATTMPGAKQEPLPSDMGGALNSSLGLVLHVTAGNGDPFSWWARPDVEASAHFYVGKDGTIVQYIPLNRVAWAEAGGNAYWHSAETEGQPGESLTPAQIEGLAKIYAFGHNEWGWKLQASEGVWNPGFGWHGMGGTAWGGHFGCPGEQRKAQRPAVLARAQELLGGGAINTNRFLYEPLLRTGSSGVAVELLQKYLNAITGAGLAVDGAWGPKTQTAVLNFQRFFHLATDGIVGPATWATLDYIADVWEAKNHRAIGWV